MDKSELQKLMQAALASYSAGCPLIILDNEEDVLHGALTLKRIREQKLSIAVHTIYGIPRELFESSGYQDSLTVARLRWLEEAEHERGLASTA